MFHRVAVFGKQATNAAASLSKGSPVLVSGELQFGTYEDTNTREQREGRQIIADHVALSLQFNPVQELRAPKGPGPEVQHSTTGPVATPAATGATALAR